jgi:hypothetical protein
VAALDYVPSGDEVLETASNLAKAISAMVRLVHANDLGVIFSAPAQEMLKGRSARAKAALAQMLATVLTQ